MLKINNPGNIRNSNTIYIGEITPSNHKSFKTFENMFYGYRAMFRLLNTYITQHKLDTIEKMIQRYAPPIENETESYIKFVCEKSGINKDDKLIKSDNKLIDIVYAMSWMENGIKPKLREVEIGYELINVGSVNEGNTIINDL